MRVGEVFFIVRKDCDMFESKRIVSGGNELFQDVDSRKLYTIL